MEHLQLRTMKMRIAQQFVQTFLEAGGGTLPGHADRDTPQILDQRRERAANGLDRGDGATRRHRALHEMTQSRVEGVSGVAAALRRIGTAHQDQHRRRRRDQRIGVRAREGAGRRDAANRGRVGTGH